MVVVVVELRLKWPGADSNIKHGSREKSLLRLAIDNSSWPQQLLCYPLLAGAMQHAVGGTLCDTRSHLLLR